MKDSDIRFKLDLGICGIGFIVWIVFLILKLYNLNSQDFSWLTWFWVWFPLWVSIVASIVLSFIYGITLMIIYFIKWGGDD